MVVLALASCACPWLRSNLRTCMSALRSSLLCTVNSPPGGGVTPFVVVVGDDALHPTEPTPGGAVPVPVVVVGGAKSFVVSESRPFTRSM